MAAQSPSLDSPITDAAPAPSTEAPLEANDALLARDITTSKVGGVPPDRPEGSSPNTPRFMTSTWTQNPENYKFGRTTFWAWTVNRLRYKGAQVPKMGKMGVHSAWTQHKFVLPRAMIPVALQYISMKYLNITWPLPLAFLVYAISLTSFAHMMLHHIHVICEKNGFLDGQVPRDGVPDVRLNSTAIGLFLTVTIRPLFGTFVAYNRYELPHFTWWFPVNMFIFTCVLDFWFYMYHRAMHEVDFLWRFHKTHHMTKHPNPLLSAFGDPEQDFFDILIIPVAAYLVYPLAFHEWWVVTVYILYIEAAGHSGARVYWNTPITGPVLRWFDMELILEDHDLHHRNGWRQSSNYGKQTRIWDKLFGTTRPRLEMVSENIDWTNVQ